MEASIHVLTSVDTMGYFEADLTRYNPFCDDMSSILTRLDETGCVKPLEDPGIGIHVDEAFLSRYPLIDGPCYV